MGTGCPTCRNPLTGKHLLQPDARLQGRAHHPCPPVAIPLRGSISCNHKAQEIMTEAWGIAESQSPYGEASLATWLSFTPTPLEKSCRNPLTGKHLLQLVEFLAFLDSRTFLACRNPLTGKHLLQQKEKEEGRGRRGAQSQSPYGEASLATHLKHFPGGYTYQSQSPYGEASLATPHPRPQHALLP